jgi:uncharacterized membrane protein YfcA
MDIQLSLLLSAIAFAASLIQGFTGFGVGLVAMPLLISLMGIRLAAPMGAPIILTIIVVTLLRYRRHLDLRAVLPLWGTSIVGIPVGVLALSYVNERLLVSVFGILIVVYALYAIVAPRLPEIRSPAWAPLFGVVAGFCTGAYNGSGPPVIVYGSCRRWDPDQFRSNLQAFFLINSAVVNVTHLLSGHVTGTVLSGYLVSLPGIGLGLLAGFSLARRFSPEQFRRTILWVLLLLGFGMLA